MYRYFLRVFFFKENDTAKKYENHITYLLQMQTQRQFSLAVKFPLKLSTLNLFLDNNFHQ